MQQQCKTYHEKDDLLLRWTAKLSGPLGSDRHRQIRLFYLNVAPLLLLITASHNSKYAYDIPG